MLDGGGREEGLFTHLFCNTGDAQRLLLDLHSGLFPCGMSGMEPRPAVFKASALPAVLSLQPLELRNSWRKKFSTAEEYSLFFELKQLEYYLGGYKKAEILSLVRIAM